MSSRCDEILPMVRADFDALWHCKPRGNSIEITTPFSTTTRKCVSVFITTRETDFIVSDGGWIEDSADFYELNDGVENVNFHFYLEHYLHVHGVSVSYRPDKTRVFFKRCSRRDLLSSCIYDVTNFVLGTVNAVAIPQSASEEVQRETFRQQANEYLQAHFENVQFRQALEGVKSHRYSAVIAPRPSSLILISYVTGSSTRYFGRELNHAICGFMVANNSVSHPYIRARVALLDDSAGGYSTSKFLDDLGLLPSHNAHAVTWRERESLESLVE